MSAQVSASAVEGANKAAAAPSSRRRATARGAAIAAALALSVVGWLGLHERWAVARELVLSRGTGWVALGALLLSLCMTPLGRIGSRLSGRAKPAADLALARRALGITAAWLALGHACLSLALDLHGNLAALLAWPHLRAGLAALCVLLVLLLTSFGALIARLRLRFWKELHRLAYVAALLALQHVLLSPFAPRTLTLVLFGAAFLLGLARFL